MAGRRTAAVATVRTSAPRPYGFAERPSTHPLKVLTALSRKVLEARPPSPGIPGERNNTLFWAACRAWEHVDRGLFPPDAVRATLLDAARQAGVADGAAVATIDSARRITRGWYLVSAAEDLAAKHLGLPSVGELLNELAKLDEVARRRRIHEVIRLLAGASPGDAAGVQGCDHLGQAHRAPGLEVGIV